MVKADVELGGTDQLFNLMQGRQLQGGGGQPPQVILTTPILEGLDGRKMSKSYGNHIGLEFAPKEIFGRTMAIPDRLLPELVHAPHAGCRRRASKSGFRRGAIRGMPRSSSARPSSRSSRGRKPASGRPRRSKPNFRRGDPRRRADGLFAPAARDGAIDASHAAFRGDLSRVAEGKVGFANFPQVIAQLSGETASAARQLMARECGRRRRHRRVGPKGHRLAPLTGPCCGSANAAISGSA